MQFLKHSCHVWQGRFHQLDELEYTCSAAQARNRWPAEAIFGNVLNTPSLQGVIDASFLQYAEQAYLVAYFNLWFYRFNVEPKGWKDALEWWQSLDIDNGVNDDDVYFQQGKWLMYLIKKVCSD